MGSSTSSWASMAVLPTVNLGTGRTATSIDAGIGNTTHMGDGSGEMGDNLNAIDL